MSDECGMMNEPKIKALAPWFGGKRTLAPTIVEELGKHASFWDVTGGGFSILFAKDRSSHKTVNDLHGDLINMARVVASDDAPALYERLQRTLHCDALVEEGRKQIAEDYEGDKPDLERAYWYFVVVWAGRNGVAGTKRINYQMAVRWTHGGGSGGVRFRNAVESLPWWHQRIRTVEILRRDLFQVLPRIHDESGTVIYVDPPYFRRGARSGGSPYLYEFGCSDHSNLAGELQRFTKARVVVSYYDDEALDGLYPGWTKRQVYRNKNLHVQNRRGANKRTAPEVLLINGPSLAEPAGPMADGLVLWRPE